MVSFNSKFNAHGSSYLERNVHKVSVQESRNKLVSALSETHCALRPIHGKMIHGDPSVGVEAGFGESPEALDVGGLIAGAPGDHACAGIE